ncbi:MAG: hypothetical protein KC519_11180 [Anaerolineae bacterium]|nr:hypothetical protein [Anaerolineae bacterium]
MSEDYEGDIEVFWIDLENTPRYDQKSTITCGVIDDDARRYGTVSVYAVATRNAEYRGETILVHLIPNDAELTRIIHGLEEARRRLRKYRGEDLPTGARLLARSDVGLAYIHNGRLVVEAPGARLEMQQSTDLDLLSEVDALMQAAGDMIAEEVHNA